MKLNGILNDRPMSFKIPHLLESISTRVINNKTFLLRKVDKEKISIGFIGDRGKEYLGDIHYTWARSGGWGWQWNVSGQTLKSQKDAILELHRHTVGSGAKRFRGRIHKTLPNLK
jgi:hypothetical protein